MKNVKKRLFCIALGLIVVQIVFLLCFQLYVGSHKAFLERKYSFSNKKNTYKNLADQQLTLMKYKQEIQEMTDLINSQNPSIAIDRLKEEMSTDSQVLFGCHEILHAMGRISYKKYNDLSTAMEYRDEVCVGGYIHGVIEGYFASSKPNFSNMYKACSKYTNNSYMRWDCFHGMGHGLMLYTSNNVPESLVGCNIIKNQFDQTACYNGTYMENFNADTVNHPSKYLNLTNPFSLCAKDKIHPEQCYTNAPFAFLNYYNNDYKGVLEWCDEAPEVYRNSCYEGAGAQITRRMIHSPDKIEQLCMSSTKNKIAACVSGSAEWIIGQNNSQKQAENFCNNFTLETNKQVCLQTLQNSAYLFAK
ncbi:MAG TPA: hypothetical protein VLG12_01520 [Candidatus Saccharimonadales bacterium]|nr:hypothetical protein [Candidatus Saccharimonadales bacterium]